MAEFYDWSKTTNFAPAISVGAIPDNMLGGDGKTRGYRDVKQGRAGEPRRHAIVGEPFETTHPYHKDHPGLESFVDVFEEPNQVRIGFMHTDPAHRGKGNASALMKHVYDTYDPKRIIWGERMDDAADHMWHDYRKTMPERTARILVAGGENWVYLNGQVAKGIQPHHILIHTLDHGLEGEPVLGQLSNTWVAGNGLPKGLEHDVARGTYDKKGRPQIWESNVDRNHVWDAVSAASMGKTAALTSEEFEGQPGNTQHITLKQQGTIPTSVVATMPGGSGEMPGEHRNRKGQFWTGFLDDIRENGIQEPLLVFVDPGQAPVLAEGNHRRDAAVELGLPEVPVEIRYFGHAEQEQRIAQVRDTQHEARGYGETAEEMYAALQGKGWDVLSMGPKAGKWSVTIQNQQGSKVERQGNTQEQALASALTWAWQHSHMSKEQMELPINPEKKTLGQVFARLRPNESDGTHLGIKAHANGYTMAELDTFLELQEADGTPRGWKVFKDAAIVAYASRGWQVESGLQLVMWNALTGQKGGPQVNSLEEGIELAKRQMQNKNDAGQQIIYRAQVIDPMFPNSPKWDTDDTSLKGEEKKDNPYGWEIGKEIPIQRGGDAPVDGDWAFDAA